MVGDHNKMSMHVIIFQLNKVTRILEYIYYCNYFFIVSIDFLGGRPSRKSQLTWRLMTVKENLISLRVKSSQGNNIYLGGLECFLGGCQLSRKLIYLAAIDPQENLFPWRL
jgi:hypothetical protein